METIKRLTQNEWQSTGIALLRIMVGLVLMAHGIQKLLAFGIAGTAGFLGHAGIPFPMVSAVLLIGAESLGGLALILGLFTRPAAHFNRNLHGQRRLFHVECRRIFLDQGRQ